MNIGFYEALILIVFVLIAVAIITVIVVFARKILKALDAIADQRQPNQPRESEEPPTESR